MSQDWRIPRSVLRIIKGVLRKYTLTNNERDDLRSRLLLKSWQLEQRYGPYSKDNEGLYQVSLENLGKDLLRNKFRKGRQLEILETTLCQFTSITYYRPSYGRSAPAKVYRNPLNFDSFGSEVFENVPTPAPDFDFQFLLEDFCKLLTPEELKIVKGLLEGKSQVEGAENLGVTVGSYNKKLRKVREKAQDFISHY